jgi:cysteinyl-tRNA synthetase
MRLFDTLSREVRELAPIDGETFRFYCCGPTVYGPAHIGNFRTFVLQDVLRRALEVGGMKTRHVRNITDVDDKTIRDSQAAGETLVDFTTKWTAKFHADAEKLGLLVPHIEPRAVEHVPQQVAMIEALVEKGNAYVSDDGSVYFKISSFPGYGRLSRLDTRELDLGKTQNARANADEYEKDSISDFVLWKARRDEDGENWWDSPWGPGRPGWHLECSAMIREYLGESFDLHGGGEDLIFPHHENEIAQSACACGGQFAAHWFHGTHLLVDGGKMSKSLGNLYTLADLEEKGWSAMEVRYVLLSGHYRKQLNFTMDSLHAGREALGKLADGEAGLRKQAGCEGEAAPDYDELAGKPIGGGFDEAWQRLSHDLNTPAALGAVFKRLRYAVKLEPGEAREAWLGLHGMLAALGLVLPVLEEPEAVEVPEEVREIAEKRWAARQAKDWAVSDELRDKLKELGWVVKDGRDGYEVVRG